MKNNELDYILTKLPSDISSLILIFLYDNKETLSKYHNIWKIKNRKQLIIIDRINIPKYKKYKYFLTLKNYNEFPCWYCKGLHTFRICIPYMKDISKINRLLEISN